MSRQETLSIDAAACDGVGMCALVAPDLITLDGWGFPVIDAEVAAARAVKKARAAARACPHRALRAQSPRRRQRWGSLLQVLRPLSTTLPAVVTNACCVRAVAQ